MDFFAEMGCCVSDHALEYVMYAPASEEKTDEIFKKSLKGEGVSREEEMIFKTAFMQFVGKAYHEKNWVMQIHYGCKRDNNAFMYKQLGPDTGYDCINNYAPSAQTADFLNSLIATNEIPKTILYSLNPNDNEAIGTILGCKPEDKRKSSCSYERKRVYTECICTRTGTGLNENGRDHLSQYSRYLYGKSSILFGEQPAWSWDMTVFLAAVGLSRRKRRIM